MDVKFFLIFAAGFSLLLSTVPAAEEDTPLSKEMTAMNKSVRLLKRQLADPAKKADNLALLEKIKKNLDAAHKLEPAKTKDVPAGEKPAYVEKFKQEIIELGKAMGELEAAIKVDKPDEAKKALDKIAELKEKGHKDFGVDE
jgi:Cytochrome b562